MSERQRVLRRVVGEAMIIDLHVEMPVGLGRVRAGIARVPEGFSVGSPGEIAAGRRILHARDRRADLLAARRLVDVQRPVFAAVLRQRHGDELSVGRWNEPVDRCKAFRVERVRIEHGFAALWVRLGIERDQHRLLFRRLKLHRE